MKTPHSETILEQASGKGHVFLWVRAVFAVFFQQGPGWASVSENSRCFGIQNIFMNPQSPDAWAGFSGLGFLHISLRSVMYNPDPVDIPETGCPEDEPLVLSETSFCRIHEG